MGYNSVVVVLNDGLDQIEKHPEQFVHKMIRGIQEMSLPKQHRRQDEGVGNHANPFSVVSCEHADAVQVLLVGGNYGELLSAAYAGGHHENTEQKVAALNRAAEKLGYKLVKDPRARAG